MYFIFSHACMCFVFKEIMFLLHSICNGLMLHPLLITTCKIPCYSPNCLTERSELKMNKDPVWQQRIFLDFSLTVKAAPHECVIRTCQP